jgi:hypothetical protein
MARNSFSRLRKPKIVGKKFIIVCEGKTEYNYFNGIRKSLRLQTLQVNIGNPGASDPLSLVRHAIELRNLDLNDGGWTEGDTAWAVFDGDEHREHNSKNWHEALHLAKQKKIELAISNPSFELCLLLHYQNQHANIHRDKARSTLKKYLPNYEKGDSFYPDPLAASTSKAVERARDLAVRIERGGWEKHYNPSTGICDLIEGLRELGRI